MKIISKDYIDYTVSKYLKPINVKDAEYYIHKLDKFRLIILLDNILNIYSDVFDLDGIITNNLYLHNNCISFHDNLIFDGDEFYNILKNSKVSFEVIFSDYVYEQIINTQIYKEHINFIDKFKMFI